jgi:hypothetical protein
MFLLWSMTGEENSTVSLRLSLHRRPGFGGIIKGDNPSWAAFLWNMGQGPPFRPAEKEQAVQRARNATTPKTGVESLRLDNC